MKKWIKIETDLMQDERIQDLLEMHGLKGLGIYLMVRILTDGQETSTERIIEGVVAEYVSRRLINRVITGFSLFEENEKGYLHSVAREDAGDYVRTDVRTDLRTEVRTEVRGDARAGEHLIVPSEHNLEKEKEREKKKRVSVSMLLKLTTSPQERAFYQEMLERFPRVCQMDKVLTYEQFQRVQAAGYSNQQIRDILQQMENNRHLLTKYVSAYLTLNNWIKGGLSPRSLPQGDLLRGT